MIPVRCFSCGKVIAQLWEAYCNRLARGEAEGLALDALGMRRYCCRRMFLTHYDAHARMEKYDLVFAADEAERLQENQRKRQRQDEESKENKQQRHE